MVEQKELTKQELLFMECLFDGQEMRNPDLAKKMAGYDSSYPVLKIVRRISKELVQKCDDYLALYAPQGLRGLFDVINNPTEPGSKVKLQAIIELLNRAGVVAKDKTEINQAAPNYIFYLPNKQEIKD